MSLLRIFLEGDHGKQTYEDPTKPMTYQQFVLGYGCLEAPKLDARFRF
jgi:hypothetical protein